MSDETQTIIKEDMSLQEDTLEIQEVNLQDIEDSKPNILRTASDGCFEVYQSYWGKYIRSCFDPEANVEITEEHFKYFELNPDIHKIPAELWTRWVKLCFHFVNKVANSVEVSVRILRSQEDPSKYRILVPRQKVSGATVRIDSFTESIDIETGEELVEYPPQGWIPVGSSHSHNTMPAFFSGTDDKYELGDPGIHLVLGDINSQKNSYSIAASVVGSGRRFEMHYNNLIDATPIPDVTFHSKVIDYVDYTSPLTSTTSKGAIIPWNGNKTDEYKYNRWLSEYSNHDSNNWNDPYYFSEHYYDSNRKYRGEQQIKYWEVEDLLNDYIQQSKDDFEALARLESMLKDALNDVEVGVEMILKSYS